VRASCCVSSRATLSLSLSLCVFHDVGKIYLFVSVEKYILLLVIEIYRHISSVSHPSIFTYIYSTHILETVYM